MRFIDHGPDVPRALLREHRAGGVLFVVGAGFSKPADLPMFGELATHGARLSRTEISQ
ncbi:MAG TPA: hypothetical protein VFH89_14475 [Sphingomicrobium sp.]|nr:hypothetical protein [Sphingomicrobium sp.]